MRRYAAWVTALALSAAAWGADVVVEGEACVPRGVAASRVDDQLELSWDSGTRWRGLAAYTGCDTWVGNQFDLATISTYRAIEWVRFYTCDVWPNSSWDGFRVAIHEFTGVPGAVLWPTSGGPHFFKPSGLHGHVWVEIRICWTCPATSFLPMVNQYYNYPNCDPFTLDNNPTYRGHSWQRIWEVWAPLEGYQGYRNLMLRVVVDNSTVNVAPSSVGRVKALYY